jgi:hypothetical protein
MADDPKAPEPKTPEPPDIKALVADAVKQHGDMNTAYHALLRDRDTLRDELGETKKRLPKDGHVVLDPESAKTFAAYQTYGPPEALAKALEDGKTAATERDDLRFTQHMGEVSGLMKWKPSVLADRVKASGVETVIKDEPDPKAPTGAKLRVPHVKLEGDKTVPLAEYAKQHWADYLPALSAEPPKPEMQRGSPPSNGQGPPRPAVAEKSGRPLQPLVR